MGHIAGAYFIYVGYERLRGTNRIDGWFIPVLVVASLVPDLIDKPLAWYFGVLPTGRSLGHSLLFLVPLVIVSVAYFRSRDRPELGVAVAVGCLSHIALDALPVLWDDEASADFLLYPYWTVEPYETTAPTVIELLLASLADPYFLLEFVLLGIAIVVWLRDGKPGLSVIKDTTRDLLAR